MPISHKIYDRIFLMLMLKSVHGGFMGLLSSVDGAVLLNRSIVNNVVSIKISTTSNISNNISMETRNQMNIFQYHIVLIY